jgi:alkylation response protein AidB-like acyl-CoA dehydrogenase
VDLDLTPDQQLLRDTTRKFLHATVPLTAVRALAENGAGFDPGWWQRGAELGWTSLLVDERRGGGSISGEGLRDLALVAEEMGAMVSPGPLIATNVVAQTLSRDASDELASRVLPSMLSGESIAAWCVAEPGRDITPDGMALQARREGAEFVLDGVKRPVDTGGQADWLLVTATGSDGLSQFLVPSSAPGLRIKPLRGLDLVRQHVEIGFEGVRVPSSAVWWVTSVTPRSHSRHNCRPSWSCSAPRSWARPTGSSTSPCNTRSTARLSVARWRPIKPSSTASPT